MRRGVIPKPILIGDPAELTREDLGTLAGATRSVASLQKLRASHHEIARLSAYGLTNRQVAARTGYQEDRISRLLNSPAMLELIAAYRARIEEKQIEELDAYLGLKTSNMIAAERHIADHISELDESGELLPLKTALAISADGADRLGYNKKQTNVNVNLDFASALERAIRRSGKTIDAKAVHPPPLQALTPQAAPALAEPPSARRSSVLRTQEIVEQPKILRRA